MYALPESDNLTDVPEIPPACRRAARPTAARPTAGRPNTLRPTAPRLAPSRSMLRASYAELNRLAEGLVRARGAARCIDLRTLVNEAARHTIGASGLQEIEDPGGYLAFLANALRGMLEALVAENYLRTGQRTDVWLHLPGIRGGAELVTLLLALDRLNSRSARHCQVAVLKLFGGLSDGEVAVQLGLTEARARIGWQRASEWLSLTCSAPRQ
ncbi:hypothetical protein Pla123a_18470 [Posidoniimonas polymericola]|uniref:RNA polymerase sigma-70 ECF-like HTH domain-containing protein n=1 Tax=Posidoniimonas polymericola TaxID=2528002 RepID=A0A5C5YQF2_9BACT|nr:ECF-type sigma factor [Posidoniimonas polymericola]TWT77192.1 hypothetical protein Pla123a_18470 [Posidoniimonas polymericola]